MKKNYVALTRSHSEARYTGCAGFGSGFVGAQKGMLQPHPFNPMAGKGLRVESESFARRRRAVASRFPRYSLRSCLKADRPRF